MRKHIWNHRETETISNYHHVCISTLLQRMKKKKESKKKLVLNSNNQLHHSNPFRFYIGNETQASVSYTNVKLKIRFFLLLLLSSIPHIIIIIWTVRHFQLSEEKLIFKHQINLGQTGKKYAAKVMQTSSLEMIERTNKMKEIKKIDAQTRIHISNQSNVV